MSLSPEVRRGGNLPFGMVSALWMCDPRYSTNARTLYAILVTYADTQGRDTRKGKPYRKELAAQMGVSVSTVDRTLVEMEVAGIVTIESRVDPANPANNEANVYHLHDAPLMWQGNGTWKDPLPLGVKAVEAAKQLIERRRSEKREAGVERRGGVQKGVSTKAVKASRDAAPEGEASEGGGSTGAARGSSTDAARVAAPVLPNIKSPLQTPSPEPSSLDGRRPSTGSSVRARESGSAASNKDRSPSASKTSKAKHTRAQLDLVRQVRAFYPEELAAELPELPVISQAILDALAGDVPGADRTAQQLGARIRHRWLHHGWLSKHWDPSKSIDNPAGVAVALVKPLKAGDRYGCANPRCENGFDVDDGAVCTVCPERLEARRVERRQQKSQEPAGEPGNGSEADQMSGATEAAPVSPQRPGRRFSDRECAELMCGVPLPASSTDTLCRSCRASKQRAVYAATAPF